MAEITATSKRGKNSHRSWSSTRVDLTPMVDLGFLLITFFVLTNSMTHNKAMDLATPAEGPPTPTVEKGAMTLILSKDHKIHYYLAKLDPLSASKQISVTDFAGIRKIIVAKKKVTKPSDLMYIIKASNDCLFQDAIDILDEMKICNIDSSQFAEADISPEESAIIEKL